MSAARKNSSETDRSARRQRYQDYLNHLKRAAAHIMSDDTDADDLRKIPLIFQRLHELAKSSGDTLFAETLARHQKTLGTGADVLAQFQQAKGPTSSGQAQPKRQPMPMLLPNGVVVYDKAGPDLQEQAKRHQLAMLQALYAIRACTEQLLEELPPEVPALPKQSAVSSPPAAEEAASFGSVKRRILGADEASAVPVAQVAVRPTAPPLTKAAALPATNPNVPSPEPGAVSVAAGSAEAEGSRLREELEDARRQAQSLEAERDKLRKTRDALQEEAESLRKRNAELEQNQSQAIERLRAEFEVTLALKTTQIAALTEKREQQAARAVETEEPAALRQRLESGLDRLPAGLRRFVEGLLEVARHIEAEDALWLASAPDRLERALYQPPEPIALLAHQGVEAGTVQNVLLLQRALHERLQTLGLELIYPAVGAPFDAKRHICHETDVVMTNEDAALDDRVAGVLRVGFYNARTETALRRAQVRRYHYIADESPAGANGETDAEAAGETPSDTFDDLLSAATRTRR